MTKKMTMIAALLVIISTPVMFAMSVQAVHAADEPATDAPKAAAEPTVPASEPTPVPTTTAPDQAAAGQPAAPVPKAEPAEVVMAWVGDKKITVEQFMNYIKQDTRLVIKATKAPGRAEILREMILDRLIEEGMRREGLLPEDHAPSAQEYLQAYQQLASRHFPKANEVPSEQELYKYYQQHPEFFGIPAMVRVGQIQFQIPADADEKAKALVKAKAEAALKRLRAGESFAVLAEALTDNPQGKVAKGDLGFLQPDKDPWLQKVTTGMEIGQISEVLESPVGYEIILLQDKRDAMIAPYANVRDNVIGRVRQEAHAKAREEYAWKLAKEVRVTVERPELKSALPQTTP